MKRSPGQTRQKFPGRTVGITGAIGSGKSAVCSLFAGLGRHVVAADPLARELMETDVRLKDQLRRILGHEIFEVDGRLDRKRVAEMIFSDRSLRDRVNAAVHPAVFSAIATRLETMPDAERSPYVVIEAALVYESGMERMLSSVVVVDAPLEERLARVMTRDGSTRDEFLRRESAQMKANEKVRRADFVINNVGPVDRLADRVRFLDRLFVTIYASPERRSVQS